MIKGAETTKLSNIIREQCLNNFFKQLSLTKSDLDDPSIIDSTSVEEDSNDDENLPTHFMALPAEGPSVTELRSETEEEVLNKNQPRANPPTQQQS